MRYGKACVLMSAILLTAGGSCVSIAETGGRLLDGSVFSEKKLASYREKPEGGIFFDRVRRKNGQEFITIRLDSMPNLRINGSLPDENGDFYLTSLDFLSPSVTGWNEFSMELSGNGNFAGGAAQPGAGLQLKGPVETLDINRGKIRRGNSRITGVQAITALHNRRERITAIVQWMKDQGGLPDFADQDEFENYWKPILFPEIVKAKLRPGAWTTTYSGMEQSSWILGEDIKWNSVYTEAVFPEALRPVRNSGTLLRDWEEAAAWIYFEFEWERIVESLSEKIELKQIK
ncbi:MAG: hypothetical protein LBB68_05020 [Treponema sp.]|jgi:hypothetical protein|nr:hypothetical protein [Treponema sp.]